MLAIHVVACEGGDETTPLEDRPQVRFAEDGDLAAAIRTPAGCRWTEMPAADEPPGRSAAAPRAGPDVQRGVNRERTHRRTRRGARPEAVPPPPPPVLASSP
jgi:hypothetical protein